MDQQHAEQLWGKPISNYNDKAKIAARLVEMIRGASTVSAGSGSTSFLTLCALAEDKTIVKNTRFIVTSFEIESFAIDLGLTCVSLWQSRADIAFDGADEIDPGGNMLKGRGGAFFLEKLAMHNSNRKLIVADASKNVASLGERMPLPIEVAPVAARYVMAELRRLAPRGEPRLRMERYADSPSYTARGNIVIDFACTDMTFDLNGQIKALAGVLDTGFFPFDNFEFV